MITTEAIRRGGIGGTPGTKCETCKKEYTEEGHDGCLGTLIGLMNACCGHEERSQAYVQFWDGEYVRGEDAWTIINVLKKYKKEEGLK